MNNYPVDAMKETFANVTVLGHPMLFTCFRIDYKTVPDELFIYDVSHDYEQCDKPTQITNFTMVNHFGTLISDTKIDLELNFFRTNAYRDIDPENDWHYDGSSATIQDYIKARFDQ